jgi:hypothetical protein
MRSLPPILDTMILQAFVFGHPQGCKILLEALEVDSACFPAEVYNVDEDRNDLPEGDHSLSEFARGIRWARRQVESLPAARSSRYQVWLNRLRQLHTHIQAGELAVDPLTIPELSAREAISQRFGIGRGESACLVLAQRRGGTAVFVSSDELACLTADALSVPFRTVPELLERWILRVKPIPALVQVLLNGMAYARFSLRQEVTGKLMSLCRESE